MSIWDKGNDIPLVGRPGAGNRRQRKRLRVVIYILNVRCFLSIKGWMPSRSLDVSLELKEELRDGDDNLEDHQLI